MHATTALWHSVPGLEPLKLCGSTVTLSQVYLGNDSGLKKEKWKATEVEPGRCVGVYLTMLLHRLETESLKTA